MYAVVRTGGKQYRVAPGDTIQVEKLPGDAGDTVRLPEVLLIVDGEQTTLGAPLIDGACVQTEVVEQGRGQKLIVYKYKRRKRYRRKNGHRQPLTSLRITSIERGA